jgi:putative adenylate-forming enzyme
VIAGPLHAVNAFARTRWLQHRLRTRDDVNRWRERRVRRFLDAVAPRVAFYREYRGAPLDALPVMDKAMMLSNFAALNVQSVTSAEAWAAIEKGQRVRGLVAGFSTGTSGNRGLFLVSERERFTWLGVILAKTLPDFPLRRHRVALALPASSALYESASETGRIALRFFDLRQGLRAWRQDLEAFAPDTIVAPPKVLRALAEDPRGLRPQHLFSAAEVLDPLDERAIEQAFDLTLRQIYQATEGLFAVSCPAGTIHLCEDIVAFEWEHPVGGSNLVAPVITDFTRSTQIMARYRMNDLLLLSPVACACGSPLQPVTAIFGRADDVFILPAANGGEVLITPDILRNAVIDTDRAIEDFRVTQVSARGIEVRLPDALGIDVAKQAAESVARALRDAGAARPEVAAAVGVSTPYDQKLRRVHRAWKPSGSDR